MGGDVVDAVADLGGGVGDVEGVKAAVDGLPTPASVVCAKGPGGGDPAHIGNFLEAIRGNAKLNSPIEEAQKSTMLCHLGNIAYRTDTYVLCDPKTGKVLNNPGAEKLWKRDYRPGWAPTV